MNDQPHAQAPLHVESTLRAGGPRAGKALSVTAYTTIALERQVADLQAELDRLRGELSQVRRERDNARAALSWIDSLQALEAIDELEEPDRSQAGDGGRG